METKDKKKKILVAVAGIIVALKKGYDVLNSEGELPEIEDNDDLARLSLPILKGLQKKLDQIAELERFDGMTDDEIQQTLAEEKETAIKRLLDESAETLRKMRPAAPVTVEPTDETFDGDQDNENDDGDQESIDETYKSLLERRSSLEKEIKGLTLGSVAFDNANKMLVQLNGDIEELESHMKD